MIYICGDSFGVSDAAYGESWTDLLSQRLPIKNLSKVCASNFAISQQVQQAIDARAEYIIVLFTASTRQDTMRDGRMISYSIHSLDNTTPFDEKELEILKLYTVDFFDLDLAIKLNEIIIEHTLTKLCRSGVSFVFDQGGFEHPSYGYKKDYFKEFDRYRSQYNLWDHFTEKRHRPYFHITDTRIHQKIADYYESKYRQT